MRITERQLRRFIREAMELDLEVGDVILAGKFKNKRKIVKSIGSDDLGQPTVNGMKVLNFRIEKLMPKDKWSKKSKEALEFADQVDEAKMKITKRQLRRIIRESLLQETFTKEGVWPINLNLELPREAEGEVLAAKDDVIAQLEPIVDGLMSEWVQMSRSDEDYSRFEEMLGTAMGDVFQNTMDPLLAKYSDSGLDSSESRDAAIDELMWWAARHVGEHPDGASFAPRSSFGDAGTRIRSFI